MGYIPALAPVEDACKWLTEQTGEPWPLARILEHGVMPWFWVDDATGDSAIASEVFGGRQEGYLAPVNFAGDLQRLAADGAEARVTITKTADGRIMRVTPALRVPLDSLRFKREDLQRVAAKFSAVPAAPTQADDARAGAESTGDDWHKHAREEGEKIVERDRARDHFPNTRDVAEEIARTWRAQGRVGPSGTPLSAATIKRHALKGITADAPARRATRGNRGK